MWWNLSKRRSVEFAALSVIFIALAASLVVFWRARGSDSAGAVYPRGWVLFSNQSIDDWYPEYGFTVAHPKNWSITNYSEARKPSYLVQGSNFIWLQKQGASATILVWVAPTDPSLTLPLPSAAPSFTFDGYQAARQSGPFGETLLLWHPDHAYFATLTFRPDSVWGQSDPGNEAVFQHVAATFRFAQ